MNKDPRLIHMSSSIPIQFLFSRCKDGDSAHAKDRFTGEIIHINERGMVILVGHPGPAEGLVTMSLCREGSGICEKLLGKIKKIEQCGEEGFLLGVEFLSRVRAEKLSSPWHPDRLSRKLYSNSMSAPTQEPEKSLVLGINTRKRFYEVRSKHT
jgi:hypothetical protein